MKRKFTHPEPTNTGRRYWRSLDELAETPGFQEHMAREFPEDAANLDGVDRRKFFKLMAASFALGGMGLAAGCRRPESHFLPYGKSVEGVIPGLPRYFATSMPLRGTALPILAETHSGRPTKIEGNPSYLPHGGATTLVAQGSVLDLYDPDRSTTHLMGGNAATVAQVRDVLAKIGSDAAASKGAGLAFLAEKSGSPTRARLVAQIKRQFPAAIWSEYEAVQDEAPLAAAQAAFGENVKPVYKLAKAERIVTIDADLFHGEAAGLYLTRQFAQGRKVVKSGDPMNRLYSVESGFSLTGTMADHRLRLASSHMLAFAGALAEAITGDHAFGAVAKGLNFPKMDAWLKACAADLKHHRGTSVVIAGAHQPAAVHALAYAINAALGNIGKTVDFVAIPADSAATINELAQASAQGKVKTLVILGGNPAYNAPVDIDFGGIVKAADQVVRLGYNPDETTALASVAIAEAHYLESWGDGRTADGTITAIQPMIEPLFGGLTALEVLARILGQTDSDPHNLVFTTVTAIAGGDASATFQKFLHDGILANSAWTPVAVSLKPSGLTRLLNGASGPVALSGSNLEVRFVTDHKVDDGRFANNGWLQECPDPMSKISWDNAILVSPKLAKELSIEPKGALLQVSRKEAADFVQGRERAFIGELTVNGKTVRGPMHIQPGLSNYTVVVALGYGRKMSGRVGTDTGFSAYGIRPSAGQCFVTGATLSATQDRYDLANTQEHWSMEGRGIVREANHDDYTKEPAFVDHIGMESHAPPNLGAQGAKLTAAEVASETPRGNSLYDTPDFNGVHQWGMSIDLNTCIGCNACVVACQAENNIPIVGKEQVLRGREMHWIRLDRYYSDGKAEGAAFGGPGNYELPEDPQAVVMPVGCQHCELAPCETVCPVNATVHDNEGLNGMAYNRCIGTRYCANNCPYKVRRFNFFDWNKRNIDQLYLGPLGDSGMPELVKMVKNPEVTVRMRGVMEKCTYCVQRIQNGKIAQKVKARNSDDVKVPDGTIKTACQQVCPAESIVFGDISDPHSAVSQAKAREQDYALLGYLNVRPRTTYSGKLRNPNPEMPDYAAPFSRQEYDAKNHPAGHGGGEGHSSGHDPHESSPESSEEHHGDGHAAIAAIKKMGGLS